MPVTVARIFPANKLLFSSEEELIFSPDEEMGISRFSLEDSGNISILLEQLDDVEARETVACRAASVVLLLILLPRIVLVLLILLAR